MGLGLAALLALPGVAGATLMGRLPTTAGGTDYQAAYDDVLDITWVTTAALSGPGTWSGQVAWADGLNYLGFDDWRLASMSVAAGLPTGTTTLVVDCRSASETACRDNELGYMYYHNIGGTVNSDQTGNKTVDGVLLTDIQRFYWSGTELDSSSAWGFNFLNGSQNSGIKSVIDLYGWAVRPGDVAAVPEPGTLLLTGTALVGLLGFGRRKRGL